MIKNLSIPLALLTLLLTTACQSTTIEETETATKPGTSNITSIFQECTEPRRQACTREYRPVCASKDTGVRCVKAPCPSTEKVTYANACTACSDSKVYGYINDACQ